MLNKTKQIFCNIGIWDTPTPLKYSDVFYGWPPIFPQIWHYINKRDHPFKASPRFLTPTPPPSCRQFVITIRRQIWQIFDPSPPKNTEILNAWSNGYQNITWSLHLKDTSIFSTLWSKTGHLKYFSGSKLPSLGPLSLILGPWITFGYLYIGRTPWKRHEVVLYLVIGPSQGPKIRRGSYYCGGHNLPHCTWDRVSCSALGVLN